MNSVRALCVAVIILAIAVGFLTYRSFFHDEPVVVTEAVQLVDDNGKVRAILGVNPKGTATFALFDKDGKERATVGLLEDGSPVVVMRDKEGKAIWGAP